ncbi:MAG: acyl-ACP desaturase [Acidobacteria bacterium]|nr:acyl-ACP desaturase [Acidobacteriota bacterium]
MFETEREVLDWYERQPRAISPDFLAGIRWEDVKRHPLNPAFVPVLHYMRDVESYTAVYYRELLRTPTGRDPVIRKFMDRWGVEEMDHGALLNRFMEEAGVPTSPRWQEEALASIPLRYTLENYAAMLVTNRFGRSFSGTHMVWGAINEMTTLQAYRRLWKAAGHPVLELVLRAIAREESAHGKFYASIARLRLERSKFTRGLARFFVERFWGPVGQGTKPRSEMDYVIGALFGGDDGLGFFDEQVSRRIRRLPGLDGLETLTRRMAESGARAMA